MSHTVLASAVNHPDMVQPYMGLFNHRILRSLRDEGLDVDVVSPRPFAPPIGPGSEYAALPRTEQWGGYTVHHPRFFYLLPKRYFYAFAGESFRKRVPAYVERTFEIPDVVHACHIYLDGYGLLPYTERHDIPLFVVAHGHFLNNYGDLEPGVQEKVDETMQRCTKLLCVSDALAEKAREHLPRSKVETVPIGADPTEYPVEQEAALRAELGIDPDATVVLFVGEFCERKGIPELIEVLPNVPAEGTEFVFVGHGGSLHDSLKQALAATDHGTQHLYTGLSSLALRRWQVVADLLVLPSHAEGRPTVIYEAMAAKTAVLSTTVGGIPEQVVDGETGVLIPPGDTAALEDALLELVGDRPRLRELGENGHARLLAEDWTWTGHATRVRALHEEALR